MGPSYLFVAYMCSLELIEGRHMLGFLDTHKIVFTRMPGESYRRRLRPLLLCSNDVFGALINSLVC